MIDNDLLGFIRGVVRSVWALELLFLMRANRGREWTVPELVRDMRASEPLVTAVLTTFESAGLVARTEGGRVTYAPVAPALDRLSADLERAYREKPVKIVNLIVASSADERLHNFADAFRFRDEGK